MGVARSRTKQNLPDKGNDIVCSKQRCLAPRLGASRLQVNAQDLMQIKRSDSSFEFFPYQRYMLRAMMRYNKVFITATRAASKTFLSILGKYFQCCIIPNHVGAIVAPNKQQAATITKQKLAEIWATWPLLERELDHYNAGKDYVECYFRNGSVLKVVGANL